MLSPEHNPVLYGAKFLMQSMFHKGYDSAEDMANFEDTPTRVSKAYDEFVYPLQEIKEKLEKIIATSFPMTGDPGIVIQDCVTISICPHHMLPVINQMYVGYLPKDKGKILGMSKLIRIADLLSKRPVLQERLAVDITATLFNGAYDDAGKEKTGFPFIDSKGAICVMGSLHCCMATRGVKSFSIAREVSLRGEFFHNREVKEEAFSIIRQFPSKQFPL